ncbi:hypothetical protein LINGRAHAP2_LOCUS5300 [Linum grandiflorum]
MQLKPTASCSSTSTKLNLPDQMLSAAAAAPVAVGTRGTVGSLVRKEIDYFINLDTCGSSSSTRKVAAASGSGGGGSSCSSRRFWPWRISWRRKRCGGGGGGSKLLHPGMCATVDVGGGCGGDSGIGISGRFSYRVLKHDYVLDM